MSRWLESAQRVTPRSDKTDKTHKTAPEVPKPQVSSPHGWVLSELSVLSGGAMTPQAEGNPSAKDRILAAIMAGNKTPGAIATATRLGATATYQELDRMVMAETLTMARYGTYRPTQAAAVASSGQPLDFERAKNDD